MTRLTGFRCDHCGAVGEDIDGYGNLTVGWFRVQHKVHGAEDDFRDVGHFCSERCMVARLKRIKDPAPALGEVTA